MTSVAHATRDDATRVWKVVAMRSLSLPLLLAACGPAPGTPSQDLTTWSEHVAPILGEHCAVCHQPGGASSSLLSWEETAPLARVIASATSTGRMPPWGATPGVDCQPPHPFLADPTLSPAQVALLASWADQDAPEGAPGVVVQAPPLPEPPRADITLVADTPLALQEVADVTVCHALDPDLSEVAWISAVRIEPGDRSLTHHAVLMRTGSSLVRGWFPCSGTAQSEPPMGFWGPGSPAFEAPAGSAQRLPAGQQLVLQVHLHPTAPVLDVPPPRVMLELLDEPPATEARFVLLGNAKDAERGLLPGPADDGPPRFFIPAGAAAHTETMLGELPGTPGETMRVWAVGHHMHGIGSAMQTHVAGGELDGTCLLSTPAWRYNNHQLFHYDAPPDQLPELPAGSQLKLACTYDNRASHPGTAETLADASLTEPVDVRLGGDALDEMCSTLLGVLIERQQP